MDGARQAAAQTSMASLAVSGRRQWALTVPPLALVKLAAAVLLLALAGNVVSLTKGALTPIWVANAVIVYALLRSRRRDWPALLVAGALGNMAASLLTGHDPVRALSFPLFNIVEVLIIALPLRLSELDRDFAQPRALLAFYLLALGPAPACSALLGSLYLHAATGAPLLPIAANWYAAAALGQSILVPPLMTVRWKELKALFSPAAAPGTLLNLAVVLAAIGANYLLRDYPLAFLFFPAVLLLTFQRGFAGGALGTMLIAAYLILPVLMDDAHGALRGHPLREQIMLVQMYVAVIGFTVVLTGAALDRRRKLEKSLAEAHEEALVARDAAEQANRAKTMFLANMSHELRTPLNAVIGFSELMHGQIYGPLGDARYRDYASRVAGAGRHLLELIGNILDMSKIESGRYEIEREDLAADHLVRDCLELMRERARQVGVHLALETEGPQRVFADRRALKQILLNLLSNALKFTPAGGRVTTRSAVVDGTFVLSVCDTGIGIPQDELERLGNPFVQLRRSMAVTSQPGTGLGLALVRALAEMHGGTMHIDSVEGQGATVSVAIPLAEARLAA
jgi:signal transduction histidine kinase